MNEGLQGMLRQEARRLADLELPYGTWEQQEQLADRILLASSWAPSQVAHLSGSPLPEVSSGQASLEAWAADPSPQKLRAFAEGQQRYFPPGRQFPNPPAVPTDDELVESVVNPAKRQELHLRQLDHQYEVERLEREVATFHASLDEVEERTYLA